MIIKEAEYKEVQVTQKRRISEAIYGCDECHKEIKESKTLNVTIFYNQNDTTKMLSFCSWECVLSHLPKIKTDYFLTLPEVTYDLEDKNSKLGANHLVKLINKHFLKTKQL